MRRWGVGIALVLSSRAALAEEPAAPPAEQPAQAATTPALAPDVVVLKNGDRFRGTIAELAHDRVITIVLVTGETRKLHPSEVKYAGPAEREPRERPMPAPASIARQMDDAPPGQQRVRLLSNEPGTEFFYRPSGEAVAFTSLCTTPCVSPLPNGNYQFGLKPRNEEDITPLRSVLIDVPTTLTGEVERRTGAHTAGAIVILVSILGASLTTVLPEDERPSGRCSRVDGLWGRGGRNRGRRHLGARATGRVAQSFSDAVSSAVSAPPRGAAAFARARLRNRAFGCRAPSLRPR